MLIECWVLSAYIVIAVHLSFHAVLSVPTCFERIVRLSHPQNHRNQATEPEKGNRWWT
jgi:hypothetical protein